MPHLPRAQGAVLHSQWPSRTSIHAAPCSVRVSRLSRPFRSEVPMGQLPAQVRFTGDRRTQHTARVLRIGLQLPDVQPRHPSARGEPTYVHNRTPRGTSDCKEPPSPFQTATDHPRILARTPASTHARTHPRTHTHAGMSAGRQAGRQAGTWVGTHVRRHVGTWAGASCPVITPI